MLERKNLSLFGMMIPSSIFIFSLATAVHFCNVVVTAFPVVVVPLSSVQWKAAADIPGIWRLTLTQTSSSTTVEAATTDEKDSIAPILPLMEQQQQQSRSSSSSNIDTPSAISAQLLLQLNPDQTVQKYDMTYTMDEEDEEEEENNGNHDKKSDLVIDQRSSSVQTSKLQGVWDYRDNEHSLLLALHTTAATTVTPAAATLMVVPKKNSFLLRGVLEAHKADTTTTTITAERTVDEGSKEEENEIEENDDEIEEEELRLAVENATVYRGIFLYPRHHPSYFDVYQPEEVKTISSVSLRKVFGSLFRVYPQQNELSQYPEVQQQGPTYQISDFYDKQFWLTAVPVEPWVKEKDEEDSTTSSTTRTATKKRDRNDDDDYRRKKKRRASTSSSMDDIIRLEAVDIRCYPITFFRNHTFQAVGDQKILRGRYGISNIKGESGELLQQRLWFQVSLFGAGRSAPGSVYSEGKSLSHEDRRSYEGVISSDTMIAATTTTTTTTADNIGEQQEQQQSQRLILRVDGSACVGSDLGSDARPEPVATFTLIERTATALEIVDNREEDDDDDDDEEEDDDDNETIGDDHHQVENDMDNPFLEDGAFQ